MRCSRYLASGSHALRGSLRLYAMTVFFCVIAAEKESSDDIDEQSAPV